MKPYDRPQWIGWAAITLLSSSLGVASCGSGSKANDDGTGGSAGAAGTAGSAGGGVDAGPNPQPGPGESCFDSDPSAIRVRMNPALTVLTPGQTRRVEVIVDPDFCEPTMVSFSSNDESVLSAPAAERIDLVTPRVYVDVVGGSVGQATLTASVPRGDGSDATATLPIDVRGPELPACTGTASGRVDDGGTLTLDLASIGLQAGATKPNSGSFLWHADPFDATIACGTDQVPSGFTAIGPAISFGPAALGFQREIPFSVPVNPAVMPDGARMRHVTVSYTGPRVQTPRVVGIADPRIERDGAGYKLTFLAPWLGTYQAVVKSDAGTVRRQRRLTHRAVIGVSMGGGGAAMVGLRHHDRFDVIAPLGGPVDWTWLIGHIERNHVGGFLPNDGVTPSGVAPLLTPTLPYEHSQSFNQWWYEFPKEGNGGTFDRSEYVQIFRDLALMFGNPNSHNTMPGAENLPAGVSPTDPTVVGNRSDRSCVSWVDPIDMHPDNDAQKALFDACPAERCANVLRLTNYFDDEFNPNGTFPVITVCDGTPQDETLSPYANTWKPGFNDKPLEVALAVDYNDNGVRDEDEPIIRSGHEPYSDVGADGLASDQEPGYIAGVNEDPAEDDWHPQFNPTGTENNLRWDTGEPFQDVGLDGVPNTSTSPYDFGEGNGTYDRSLGLQTFLERDSRTVIERQPFGTHPNELTDDALSRIDIWSDGGTRDLFNFGVDAQALIGAWGARGPIVHYYTGSQYIPGQDPTDPAQFVAGNIPWEDIPGGVLYRYGHIDPSDNDITRGSGQHVGTADEIVRRLQAALYYIGSRWPDAPTTLDDSSSLDPDPDVEQCIPNGACDFDFTDSRGRTGPVSVVFPPGYGNVGSRNKTYPVIYMLHGYGQTPEDLKASLLFLQNWMNSSADSSVTRLPKAILVFVDGRCRPGTGTDGESECVRGTFFTDSVRANGPKMEAWWLELMDEIDSRYRTMPESTVEWVE